LNIARKRGNRAVALTAREPRGHDLVIDLVDTPIVVQLDERQCPLAVVDVRRLLRPREQRIARPTLPKGADGHLAGARL
jgi:hypothetical protein